MRRPKSLLFVCTLAFVFAAVGCGEEGAGSSDGDSPPADAGDVSVDVPPQPQDTDVEQDVPPPEDDSGVDAEDDADEGDDEDGGDTSQPATDCDYDGLDDSFEMNYCTEKCNGDTDGDGIGDYAEVQGATDPCDSDTDDDGANDKQEKRWGLNPTDRITYDDGTLDGDRWILSACEQISPAEVGFFVNRTGNWRIGLPPSFSNYTNLTVTGHAPPVAAAVYDAAALEVAGLMLSRQADGGIPAAPELALPNDVVPRLSNVVNVDDRQNGAGFDTHGKFRAATGEYTISPQGGNEVSVRAMRDTILPALGPFSNSDLSGLPNAAGATYPSFKVIVTVIQRRAMGAPDNHLVAVGIAPADDYENDSRVQFRMNDLTNPTNIAEEGDTTLEKCTRNTADKDRPSTEFYWVLDQTTSMSDENTTVQNFANEFEEEVSNTSLDYRFGVTNMDSDVEGRLKVPPGWHDTGSTFGAQVANFTVNCSWPGGNGCSSGEEDGLYNAREGLRYMLGAGSTQPTTPEEIRSNADVITIVMSDDNANTVRSGQVSQSTYNHFFDGKTTMFSIVDPGDGQGGTACPEAAFVGSAYKEVSRETGGSTASICGDLESTIENIIDTAAAQGSNYSLHPKPITPSLKVFINGVYVPRSAENGFQYSAKSGTISFFGSYRPDPDKADDPTVAPDRIAVSYKSFKNNCKEEDNGAFNCGSR